MVVGESSDSEAILPGQNSSKSGKLYDGDGCPRQVLPIRIRGLRNTSPLESLAYCVSQRLVREMKHHCLRALHTLSRDGPTETLKRRIAELQKIRKKKNPKKDELFVEVPESKSFLDTATMPMILTVVGTALFAKLLMMHDDKHSQEMIERKIKNAHPSQGTVRMLTREEWENIREVRPRTPFESKLARPNARIRTGEPLQMQDLKDWTIDVLTDAFTRIEESVKSNS